MTVPYLMNCPHSDDSWCLECVKNLGEKSERDTALLRQALDAFEWNMNTDLDNIPACEQWVKMLKKNIAALRKRLGETG